MKKIHYQKVLNLAVVAVLLLLFSGCANNEPVNACVQGLQYGFWGGLWHGIIAPIDFIISLFRDDFIIYAPNNNGTWYALGFIIGSGGWGFLGGKGICRKRKKSDN
ncbi:MAG TPA: hypothetical protein VJ346_03950 [Bacteroidales bacterium]|nr:hypothetical protein [Bacteroidales bacterium]